MRSSWGAPPCLDRAELGLRGHLTALAVAERVAELLRAAA
jgi:hypothetical protein